MIEHITITCIESYTKYTGIHRITYRPCGSEYIISFTVYGSRSLTIRY